MRKKILFLVTEDWYFCTHRLPLAVAAFNAGYEVVVATRVSKHQGVMEMAGLKVIPLQKLKRSSLNLFIELSTIYELIDIYRRERPSLVHQVALKPVIYGSIAAWLLKVPAQVNALAGLGFIFSSDKLLATLLRPIILIALRLILKNENGCVIVQNNDDMIQLIDNRVVLKERIRLIAGAGVAIDEFIFKPVSDSEVPLVLLASRMLWDKGVGDFVVAARILKGKKRTARFILVGNLDTENPTAISHAQLVEWQQDGIVEWWGHQEDMINVMMQANVVCLPSYYGEGIPKVLLEAMSCGRPIITTDMPGCRELVENGTNGILIPPRCPESLAAAIEKLISDHSLCLLMGNSGRQIVERKYALDRVIDETVRVYDELLV